MTNILNSLLAGVDPTLGDRMTANSLANRTNRFNLNQAQEQNALRKLVGGHMAAGDFKAGQRAAFEGGALDVGAEIGELMANMSAQERARAQQAMQDSFLIRKGVNDPQQAKAAFLARYPDADDDDMMMFDQPFDVHEAFARGFENFTERSDKLADTASERAFKTSERVAGEHFEARENRLDRRSRERAAALRKPLVQIGVDGKVQEPPVPEFEDATLFQQADEAFGAVNSVQQIGNNLFGQVTGENIDPQTAKARASFKTFNRQLIRAMSLSPRFPVAEQKRIQELVGQPDAFTSPSVARENLKALRSDVEAMNSSNRFIMNDEFEDVKTRRAARSALREGLELLNRIGEPPPEAQEGAPSISSQAEYDALPSGAQYTDTQGNIRQKP